MSDISIFDEIELSLESARDAFVSSTFSGDDGKSIRGLEDAKSLLYTLKKIIKKYANFLGENQHLVSLLERQYGNLEDYFDRDNILSILFVEDFIFPESETYPVLVSMPLEKGLLDDYVKTFEEELSQLQDLHEKAQREIKESISIDSIQSSLPCQCNKCIGDFRNAVREEIYKSQIKLIDQDVDKLHEYILVRKIDDVADFVSRLKTRLDKNQQSIKTKLKRSSLNKLESDVKSYFKQNFAPTSELGRVYREKLMAFFNSILDEEGIKPDLVEHYEYDRFFTLLSIGMWKHSSILKKEFQKFIKSVLAFKRKDISATILKNYLGQFWLHADARKINRTIIYHMGPTNSGKTYHAIEALAQAKNGSYLAPLRLLASELYDTLNSKGVATTLLTGEEVIESDGATHFSSTIEMAKLNEEFECCIIDEIQMIADPQRGWAWTRALVNMNAKEIHLCGDSSVLNLVKEILKLTGDTLIINEYTRKTELIVEKAPIRLNQLKKNDALIVFSRKNALKYKMDLENLGFKVSIVYGRLSPEVRREQARKFDSEETDIIVSTDAIAMGMNLPVKRIIFSALSKFIDNKEYPLSFSEIKQIAGRAGRYGRFPQGFVTVLQKVEGGLEIVTEAIKVDLEQKEVAMVGPDLEIFQSVNHALLEHGLPELSLVEFLRLFNTITFSKPFYCVDLKEMIELAEMVEGADSNNVLSLSEKFGFTCAPVNLGLIEHVQYFVWILNHYVNSKDIISQPILESSNDIDYLESSIKCVELYQWLARHFDNRNFLFNEEELLDNKAKAVEKLNHLLSEKVSKRCSSCGANLPDSFKFNICEVCFGEKKFKPRRPNFTKNENTSKPSKSVKPQGPKKFSKNKDKASSFKKFR